MRTIAYIQNLTKRVKHKKTKLFYGHLLFLILFFLLAYPVSSQIIYKASGSNAAAISPAVTNFRTAMGTLNPNVTGPLPPGRREINWDGVPDALAAPNNLPANFFNANSPRGVVFSTPGTGFQVSANAGVAPVEFGNIDPFYPSLFAPFSPQRLFTALGSNITDINFFVPGTSIPALTRGFGAVFSDVDLTGITRIQGFDKNGMQLFNDDALAFSGNETFSFLGFDFGVPIIAKVRITTGNNGLGAGITETLPARDLVVMDDFIYGEPVAASLCTLTCPANITVPATGPSGAVVTYAAPATSGSCGTIISLPPSGSTFPVGTTTVNVYKNASQKVNALTTNNQLVTFDASTPGTVTAPILITGLQAGENIVGIDFRPVNGVLYGVGSTSRLYTINTTTGDATQVGSPFTITLSGTEFGMDFNPTVDRIRVVSNTGQNLRINPVTGAIAAVDEPLNPGTPFITGVAYTNNYALATTTTLYDIDANSDALYIQNNPNAGTLALIGPFGVNTTEVVGFDISQTGIAYASLATGTSTGFYTINLATGAASLVGSIPGNNVRDISIAFGETTPSCSFTVTVEPACTVTCAANMTVSNDPNQCGAIVNYAAPITTGSCGTITSTPASGSFFPVGITTVNVSSTSGQSCSFTIRVNDAQAPSITSCPTVSPFCINSTGKYTIPALTATDNCPGLTVSYSISGATTRTGTGNNASGAFNPGTSTINWTARDAAGNTSTRQTIVKINVGPIVTIPDAFALPWGVAANTVYIGYAPASSITLTTNASGGTLPYGYTWSTGSHASSITVSPTVTTTYTVTVMDANGCTGTISKTIFVVDVRCGNKQDKVQVCQVPPSNPSNAHGICISTDIVAAHLATGSYLGECINATNTITSKGIYEIQPNVERLKVQAISNPAPAFFTLVTRSNNPNAMQLRVFNVLGRVVEIKNNVPANATLQLGQNYRPGMYYAEVVQGKERVILKLIKGSK